MTSQRLLRSLTTSFVLASALLLGPELAVAQQTPLAMSLPVLPAQAVDQGTLAAGKSMQVTLYLAPSATRVAALNAFLAQLSDPTSPSYRRWLTPAQFGAQFGPEPAQIAAAKGYVEAQGLQVTEIAASGLRMSVTGTVTQVEAAFAPALHSFQTGSRMAYANTAVPAVPSALTSTIERIGGLDTLANASTTFVLDGATVSTDLLSGLADAVTANTARVLSITTSECAETIATADSASFGLLAKEAAAQGMTVLTAASCSTGGTVSFPDTLAEVTSVALAPGLAQTVASTALQARPGWQLAVGLPQDGLRDAPDLTVTSLAALAQTVAQIIASLPAQADGTPARIGSLNATLYALAAKPGLFTQTDNPPAGTWEPTTGLGLADLDKLGQFYPRGALSDYVSVAASNYSPTHGTNVTLTSSVTDTSGKAAGAVPTGTITFSDANGNVLGTPALVNGTATLTLNILPGGPITVTASYAGDANFAANKSNGITFSVQGEAAKFSATTTGTVVLGGTIPVVVTVSSASGIGTPTGTVSATLQGVTNTTTETATLSGSNGTATATIQVPAVLAGSPSIVVACMLVDPSFTCYNQINVTASVSAGASTTTLNVTPNPPVANQATTFTATVTGAASPAPVPTGGVNFYDSGSYVGASQLANGTATYQASGLSATATHVFTATYVGDGNYMTSTSSGVNGGATTVATTTTLTINPTSPVNGAATTLSAVVSNAGAGAAPTGTVQFYQDGVFIGQGTIAGGTATFTTTTLDSTAAHTYTAKYLGDTINAASTSTAVATAAASA